MYSANMVTIVLSTTRALVRSVAVHSMKTSRVDKEIWCGGVGVWGGKIPSAKNNPITHPGKSSFTARKGMMEVIYYLSIGKYEKT